MAQATPLAAAKTAATSTDITVAAGATVTVGVFTDEAVGLPANEGVVVYIDTPSNDNVAFLLSGACPTRVVSGPCTLRAVRRVTSVNIGVYTES